MWPCECIVRSIFVPPQDKIRKALYAFIDASMASNVFMAVHVYYACNNDFVPIQQNGPLQWDIISIFRCYFYQATSDLSRQAPSACRWLPCILNRSCIMCTWTFLCAKPAQLRVSSFRPADAWFLSAATPPCSHTCSLGRARSSGGAHEEPYCRQNQGVLHPHKPCCASS